MFRITLGQEQDIDLWMELVAKVAWNFPGLETEEKLEEHRKTVEIFITRGTAICAKEGDQIVGVLLFSIKRKMLCFLAVDPQSRRKNIATKMIKYMFSFFDKNDVITVSTFREDDEKGIAPRALYKKMGFIEDELCVEFDYPNQLFKKVITEIDKRNG